MTLFASGDSRTAAELCAGSTRALRIDPQRGDPVAMHLVMLERAFERAAEFDVIHAHLDYLTFPIARRCEVPVVTTLHGRLDLPWLAEVYREFAEQRLVSISDAQREPLPDANWIGTVHHGLPRDLYRFHAEPGDYLAFVGRISVEKRVDRAIAIAAGSGVPLRIAAKVDPSDEELLPLEHRAAARPPARASTWASSATPTRTNSSAMRVRCCFRSTGRSRSGSR